MTTYAVILAYRAPFPFMIPAVALLGVLDLDAAIYHIASKREAREEGTDRAGFGGATSRR